MADACRELGLPVVSGNVSLYNETADGPILPTPVIGTVGLLQDRSRAIPMRWRDGDEIWLLGEPAADPAALVASELAWRRGRFGGAPALELGAGARLVRLLPRLVAGGLVAGLHDASVGGLGVALARMAIASGCGARVRVQPGAGAMAALFGERGGRVLAAVARGRSRQLEAAAGEAGVQAQLLGAAGEAELSIEVGAASLSAGLGELSAAWEQPL
jgi:phosphoribosylformylglycinamidine synthase